MIKPDLKHNTKASSVPNIVMSRGKPKKHPVAYNQLELGVLDTDSCTGATQPHLEHRIKADSIYLKKSKEAFLLAIELYNKPLISYRVEAFCTLFINAWELLMKAKIYLNSGNQESSIMREENPSLAKTLPECIGELLQDSKDTVRRNIEYIADLRNSSAHLVVLSQGIDHARVFQSGVINYMDKLKEWFPDTDASILPDNMLALVSPENLSSIRSIKKNLDKNGKKLLRHWQKRFKQLQALGPQGAIRMDYRLVLTNQPKEGDISVSKGLAGENLEFLEKERIRDQDKKYGYRTKDVIRIANERLTGGLLGKITSHDLYAFCRVEGVKKQSDNGLYFQSRFSPTPQYSLELVQRFVNAMKKPGRRRRIRDKYRQYIRRRSPRGKLGLQSS